MKIAVLFRGPLRPSITSVIDVRSGLLQQFDPSWKITSFLATWSTWRTVNSKDLLAQGLFDTVIVQPAPTNERIAKFCKRQILPSSTQVWRVFNMYYQAVTAIRTIIEQDDYDYIIHARTDLRLKFGKYLLDWFDPGAYVYEQSTVTWKKDLITVAPPELMWAAWNPDSIENLGAMIDRADVTERIVDFNLTRHGSTHLVKTAQLESSELDPGRVE